MVRPIVTNPFLSKSKRLERTVYEEVSEIMELDVLMPHSFDHMFDLYRFIYKKKVRRPLTCYNRLRKWYFRNKWVLEKNI